MKKRVYYHFALTPPLWVLQLLFFVMIAMQSLSSDYVAEYSLIECSQLLLICMAMMTAVKSFWNMAIPLDVRRCFWLVAFVALFFLAREMSWGRFFYYDESYAVSGEDKKMLKQLPFVKVVRWMMLILASIVAYYLIKHSLCDHLVSGEKL